MKYSPEVMENKLLNCLYYEDRYDRIIKELCEYFSSKGIIADSLNNMLTTFMPDSGSIKKIQTHKTFRQNIPFSEYTRMLNDQFREHNEEPFIIFDSFNRVHSLFIKILDEDRSYIGHIGIEVKKGYRLTPEDDMVMRKAARVSLLAMQLSERNINILDSKTLWNKILLELLSGKFENRERILREIQTYSTLCEYESYRLMLISRASSAFELSQFRRIYKRLEVTFKQCLGIVIYEKYIVALFIDNKIDNPFSNTEPIEKMADECSLYMVSSDPLSELWDIPIAFRQCKNTLRSLMRRHPIGRYANRDDCRLDELIACAKSESGTLKEYVSSVIADIQNYDEENETNYFETLQEYLKNNCNVSRASEEMFVHKTTMAYRLERIKEIFHLDLENYEKRLQLQVSFYIVKNFL